MDNRPTSPDQYLRYSRPASRPSHPIPSIHPSIHPPTGPPVHLPIHLPSHASSHRTCTCMLMLMLARTHVVPTQSSPCCRAMLPFGLVGSCRCPNSAQPAQVLLAHHISPIRSDSHAERQLNPHNANAMHRWKKTNKGNIDRVQKRKKPKLEPEPEPKPKPKPKTETEDRRPPPFHHI